MALGSKDRANAQKDSQENERRLLRRQDIEDRIDILKETANSVEHSAKLLRNGQSVPISPTQVIAVTTWMNGFAAGLREAAGSFPDSREIPF